MSLTKRLIAAVAVIALALCVFTAAACSTEEEFPRWDITSSVKAGFTDNGRYGFILTVEGAGALPDFSSKKDAPWYGKSGRVTEIIVKEGITSIGSNAFTDIKAAWVVLPESVTSAGAGAFNENTLVCAYSGVNCPDRTVYTYSESKPEKGGNYWHYIGESVAVWDTKPTKVLFIGNSFTFYSDIPALFKSIAEGAGVEVISEAVTQGSWTLTKFADESDEFGKKVDEKLKASSDYDAVILQEQSTRPLNNYNGFLSAVKKLSEKIKATQTDCEIYLYSTWGYKEAADGKNMTIPEMEAALRSAYESAASEIGAKVSYVGKAFTAIYTAHKQVNDEYFANPDKYAASPEKQFALYFKDDNKHPSYSGAFLSASVHAATVLGLDPTASTFTGELDGAAAAELKAAAKQVVFG